MKLSGQHGRWPEQRGFSLVEVLVAIVLIVLFLVPVMNSMTTIGHNTTESQKLRHGHRLLQDKMAEVLALPFDVLAAAAGDKSNASSYSDDVTAPARRLVFIAHYDGDATGSVSDPFDPAQVDEDLLWIRVKLANSQDEFVTLVRR